MTPQLRKVINTNELFENRFRLFILNIPFL